MTYSPPSGAAPPMVHPLGPWTAAASVAFTATDFASSTFAGNNYAFYYGIVVPTTCVVRRLWWTNGATVSASYNVDCGIYADAGHKPGTRLVSTGSTAQGTASEVQFVDVTDTTLGPGWYWLALTCSSTSATFFRVSANSRWDVAYKFSQTTALPLPSSATPVEATSAEIYLFGFATTASP